MAHDDFDFGGTSASAGSPAGAPERELTPEAPEPTSYAAAPEPTSYAPSTPSHAPAAPVGGSASGGQDDAASWFAAQEEADAKDAALKQEMAQAVAEEEAEWAPAMAAVMAGNATLRRMCRGQGVRELQRKLNDAGVQPQLASNGYFDDDTESAVRAIQRAAGLPETGEANRATITAIGEIAMGAIDEAGAMNEAPSIADVLDLRAQAILPGQEGRSVTEVQRWLNQAGAKPQVSTSGKLDQRTEAALARFQESERLPVTGAADRLTITRLRDVARAPKQAAAEDAARVTPSLHDVRGGRGVLQPGDQGTAVREAQQALNDAGMKPALSLSGTYDERTAGAVATFQREQGLGRTGVLDRATLSRLEGQSQRTGAADPRAAAAGAAAPAPTAHDVLSGKGELSLGQKGPAVKEVQEGLNAAGARPPVTADGTFSEATRNAVYRFQHEQGLPQTGTIDRVTMARLQGQYQALPAAAKRVPGYRGKTDALSLGERLTLEERVKGSMGQKLDTSTRERMEALLETDLSSVYVHTDKVAREAARAAQCEAFTLAKQGVVHIYFAEGRYDPGNPASDRLLAHELTHALQAKRGQLKRAAGKAVGFGAQGKGALEAEAEAAERKLREDKYAEIQAQRDQGRPARAPTLHEVRSGKAELVKGHQGDAVAEAQRLLNESGLKRAIGTSGSFDRATEEAVLFVQGEQGLPRTGVIDRRTLDRLEGQAKLAKARPSDGPVPAPTAHDVLSGKAVLERRHEGAAVQEVQAHLNRSGLKNPLAADGKFDSRTESAVKWFQHEQGLAQTGVVDRTTLQRLQGQVQVVAAAKRVPGYRGKDEQLSLAEKGSLKDAVKGSVGSKLPTALREQLEGNLGADLTSVYVHHDPIAEQACKLAQSEAFTLLDNGQVRIYFASGNFRAGAPHTERLLLHELTHALQIRRGELGTGARKAAGAEPQTTGKLEHEARRAEGLADPDASDKQAAITAQRDQDQPRRAPTIHEVRTGKGELSRGNHGDAVKAVQGLLNQAGAKPPVPVTGTFDRATQAGVEWFQREQGLGRTGTVERVTLARLEDQQRQAARFAAKQPTASLQDVRSGKARLADGDEGSQVREVQQALNAAGVKPPLTVTGKFDAATRTAVLWFQREQGLERSGEVDRTTLGRLEGQHQAQGAASRREAGRTEADLLGHSEERLARELVEGSQGFKLDPKTKKQGEDLLQTNLAGVWIHTDRKAQEAAKKLRSQAFTLKKYDGPHIYFAAGKFEPSTRQGFELLIHELTHALQIKRGQLSGPAKLSADPQAQGLGAAETQARASQNLVQAQRDPLTGYQPQTRETPHQPGGTTGTHVRAPGHRSQDHGPQSQPGFYRPGTHGQVPAQTPPSLSGPAGGFAAQPPKTSGDPHGQPAASGDPHGATATGKLIEGQAPGQPREQVLEAQRRALAEREAALAEREARDEARLKAAAEQRAAIEAKEKEERERLEHARAEEKQKQADAAREAAAKAEAERKQKLEEEAKAKAAADAKRAEEERRAAAEATIAAEAKQREQQHQTRPSSQTLIDEDPAEARALAQLGKGTVQRKGFKADHHREIAAWQGGVANQAEKDAYVEAERLMVSTGSADADAVAKAIVQRLAAQENQQIVIVGRRQDTRPILADWEARAKIGARRAIQEVEARDQVKPIACDEGEKQGYDAAFKQLKLTGKLDNEDLLVKTVLAEIEAKHKGFKGVRGREELLQAIAQRIRQGIARAKEDYFAGQLKPRLVDESFTRGYQDAVSAYVFEGKADEDAIVRKVLHDIEQRHPALTHRPDRTEILRDMEKAAREGVKKARQEYEAREKARKAAEEKAFQKKKAAAEGPHLARGEKTRYDDLAVRQSLESAAEVAEAADLLVELHGEDGLRKVHFRPLEEREFLQNATFKVAQWLESLLVTGSVLDAPAVVAYLTEQNTSPDVFSRVIAEVGGLRSRVRAARARLGQVLSGFYRVGAPRGASAVRPGGAIPGADAVLKVLLRISQSAQPRGPQMATKGFDPKISRFDQANKGWKPSFQTARGVKMAGVDEPGIGAGFGILAKAEKLSSKSLTSLSHGMKLDPALRDKFEREFQTDFSDVRVHTGREAEEVAKQLGAKAFTVGNDIYFAPGQFSPASRDSEALLRHELKHVKQEKERPKAFEDRGGGRLYEKEEKPQGKAHAYGALIGDAWREREAIELERKIQEGLSGTPSATVDHVVVDTSQLGALTRQLRQRADWIAHRAVSRATRILHDLGHDRKPLYLEQLDVDFVLNPVETEDDASMRLCAEIVRKVVGRWRYDEDRFLNWD